MSNPQRGDKAEYSDHDDDVSQRPVPEGEAENIPPRAVATANPNEDGHPDAIRLFAKCPWVRKVPVYGRAIEGFGPKLVLSLSGAYFLIKGIGEPLIGSSRQPMLMKRMGLSATQYQRLASLSSMGWSIKAVIAVLTDAVPLFGYTKRWYILGSCVIGAAFALGYGLLPAQPSSGNAAGAFIFLTSFGKANMDILSEGHYSRLMRRTPKYGPPLVSSMWVVINIGSLIAAVIIGPLADAGKVQVAVFISAAAQLLCSVFFIFNCYGERKNRVERLQDLRDEREALAAARLEAGLADPEEGEAQGKAVAEGRIDEGNKVDLEGGLLDEEAPHLDELVLTDSIEEEGDDLEEELDIPSCLWGTFEFNKEVVTRNWKIVVYSAVLTAGVIAMVCVTILGTTWDLMYAAIVISVVCIICAFLTLPLVIAKANVYEFFFFLLYLQIPGGMDAFYLADSSCVPDGPHFDYTFYSTVGAVIQNIGGIVGIALFNYVFTKMRYQVTLCVAISLQVIASIFDLMMVERWNIYIGIPDHAIYICGDAIVYQICYMLSYMPVVLLMCRVCPRGSESMIYALMSGFANLGRSMSNTIGSLLIETTWPIDSKSRPCDFSNLRWLLITGHLAMPLLNVPLAFLLLPSARICDDIDVNGHVVKKQVKKEEEAAEREGNEEPFHDSLEDNAAGAESSSGREQRKD